MPATIEVTVRQLHRYVDHFRQYGSLSARDSRRVQAEGFERAFAKTPGKEPRLAGHQFSLARFRSLAGRNFFGVLAIHRGLRIKRNLAAFAGHRFIPSDLAGMLCLPYQQYEDLFLEFAMRLPAFLVDRGLADQ